MEELHLPNLPVEFVGWVCCCLYFFAMDDSPCFDLFCLVYRKQNEIKTKKMKMKGESKLKKLKATVSRNESLKEQGIS